jgi:WD40 repeat protein
MEDLHTGETEEMLKLDADVYSVAISRSSGSRVAVCAGKSIVCFRDMGAGTTERAVQYEQSNPRHALFAYALELSSDESKLASGDLDGHVVLWDLSDHGMVDKELSLCHSGFITHLLFSLNDTQLLPSSADAAIRVWDVASGKTEQIL